MAGIDIDLNQIAIGVSSHIYDDAKSYFSRSFADGLNSIKLKFKSQFRNYISNSLNKTSTVKTILSSDDAVPLRSIYVPLTFSLGSQTRTDTYIINQIRSGKKILIIGTAGGGKSMLIKNIHLTMLEKFDGLVPVFYELRALNKKNGSSLIDCLYESVSEFVPALSRSAFIDGIKNSKFALILDGFDEIDYDIRDNYAHEIDELCDSNPSLSIAITTRPEDRLGGLRSFTAYEAETMSKSQCIRLLKKIEYDKEKKKGFIEEVSASLYDAHNEFLANPLMASMMLLTYSHYSDIPSKIHIFYQQAFEALYQRHDRSKGVYTRKTVSDLPIDQFQKALEYFCASSYISQQFSFGEVEVRELISDSLSYVGLNTSSESFLSDLMVSTCLLKRDGVEISFVHRSFQEYFCARFLSRLDDASAAKAIDSICERAGTDKVLVMMMDINLDLFERAWSLPRATTLTSMAKGKIEGNEYIYVPDVFDRAFLSPTRITLGNTSETMSQWAYAFWLLYDVSEREGMPDQKGEVFERFSAIRENSVLLAELKLRLEAGMILDSYFEGTADEEDNPRNVGFLDLTHASTDLMNAMGIDQVIRREYSSWCRIATDARQRAAHKVAKLENMLSKAD